MKKFLSLFILFALIQPAYSITISHKKKKKPEPMVHTVDEWLDSAQSVKMDMRKADENIVEEDKKYLPPKELPVYIEPYNVGAGSKELDLTFLNKTKNVRSPFIFDSKFNNVIYTETTFYPQTKQTASTIYLIEPDNYLSDKEKIEKLNIFEHTRYPLISTALPYLKDGFFSTLTIVDFSNSGKEFIVKEKRGSNKFGIYETYVWIYFLTDENRESSECYMNNLKISNDFSENALKNSDFSEFSINEKIDYDNSNLNTEVLKLKDMKNEEGYLIEDVPKLTYDDLNSYIKSVYKEQKTRSELNNIPKTRWYNNAPSDFRVDVPYNEKEYKGYGVRLNLLNETIKAYWFDKKELFLNHIRWDLKPLGFSSSNENEIIVQAFGYNKEGNKISLGNWAVNIKDGLPRLMGDDEPLSAQANALFLQKKLNKR